MSEPRGIEERLDWFLSHNPSGPGMCAQHSWRALGGNQNPPNPERWGTPDANAVYGKVKASGRYWTGTPKRGALVVWQYGDNGHVAICYDSAGTKIATTDPKNKPGGVGVESIAYPEQWGASPNRRIWTDEYNGSRFSVGEAIAPGDVYLSKLVYGQEASDSVARLQAVLNVHSLDGGETLPISGNYYTETDEEVRLCQKQHGYGNDPVKGSSVGPKQAEHLFAGSGCNVINDLPVPVEPVPPEPPDLPDRNTGGSAWDEYSGKPSGTLTVKASDGYVALDAVTPKAPADGLEFHMAYLHCDLTWSGTGDGDIRLKYVRDGGDATAYQDYTVRNGKEDFLITHGQHWEAGEQGVGGKWYINVGAGISKVVITTRYAKIGGVTYDSKPTGKAVAKALTGAPVGVGSIRTWAIGITTAVVVLLVVEAKRGIGNGN